MLQNDLTFIIEDKPDIKKAILELRVTGLGLGDDIHAKLLRQFSQCIGFRTRYINRAGIGIIRMISIHDLVVKPLQGAFGYGDQADG